MHAASALFSFSRVETVWARLNHFAAGRSYMYAIGSRVPGMFFAVFAWFREDETPLFCFCYSSYEGYSTAPCSSDVNDLAQTT